jgi:DNA-binding CsgD family transcriptional regulator
MPRQAVPALQRIILRRTPPGLLVFDTAGRMLTLNRVAEQILKQDRSRHLLRTIRSSVRQLDHIPIKPTTPIQSPAGPLIQTTFTSGRRTYGLQAYLINHQPKGRPPHVAVLFERVNPSRMDSGRARRRFGLSARELDVLQALKQGMSDKEIASFLGIGFETVRDYLKKIRAKLGVSTRTAILNALFSL